MHLPAHAIATVRWLRLTARNTMQMQEVRVQIVGKK